jgi:hypothetical protein
MYSKKDIVVMMIGAAMFGMGNGQKWGWDYPTIIVAGLTCFMVEAIVVLLVRR